jgi:sugar O-acyltransferase (sialic acid O-acetyltransferase NeuD family)
MIIAGAGGHAKELLGILDELHQAEGVFFFDDVSKNGPATIWDRFTIIYTVTEAENIFREDPRFIIGIGKPALRQSLCAKLVKAGGSPFSVISPYARIGSFNVRLGNGLNIMTNAVITQDVSIGKGTLVHINATVHHDCRIGEFCELSPGCHLLGKTVVGDRVSIGSGAVILPGIHIGNNAVIGAGAVVTKNVEAGSVVKGVPAKQ